MHRHLALSFLLLACGMLSGMASAAPTWDPTDTDHLAAAARYNADNAGVSFLVMVDGHVIYEDYPNQGGRTKGWELASGTKSFWGPVALIAERDGLLKLDERVCDTITEWQSDPQKSQITIRQLLNLTAGLKQSTAFATKGVITYQAALNEKVVDPAGAKFSYGQTTYQVFGEVLRRKLAKTTGEDPAEYLTRTILQPLGIAPTKWTYGKDGYPHLPSGASFTARDWATWGELIRNRGVWNGQQLIPDAHFEELFIGTVQNPGYGLTWWLARPVDAQLQRQIPQYRNASDIQSHIQQLPPDLVMAAGAGNQRLYVIPSLKLVVVRQAPILGQGLMGMGARGFSDTDFLALLLTGQRF